MKEGAPLGPYQCCPSKNWLYTADQGRSEGFFCGYVKASSRSLDKSPGTIVIGMGRLPALLVS
jgi:hypothetical protein